MDVLTRYRPQRSLRSLQEEVNRMFDDLFFSPDRESDEAAAAVWSPRIDMTETDNALHIHADLPGMKKGDIHLRLEDNRLILSGSREMSKSTKDQNTVRAERSFGAFYRAVRLPSSVKEDNVTASFKDGVLTIEIPKKESAKAKEIAIR